MLLNMTNYLNLLDDYIILQVAPGYSYTILLHDKRIMSRMANPYRSNVPISYLEVKYPQANEVILTYIRQKMSTSMDNKHNPCTDKTEYELRLTLQHMRFGNLRLYSYAVILEIVGLIPCSKRLAASYFGITGGHKSMYPCARMIRYMVTLWTSEAT